LQAEYRKPVKVVQLVMQAQGCGADECAKRAPKGFIFQGSADGQKWIDLLDVANAGYNEEGQTKEWDVPSNNEFKFFRLWIKSNNDPKYLTVNYIKLLTKK
jgi:hypothetical protein